VRGIPGSLTAPSRQLAAVAMQSGFMISLMMKALPPASCASVAEATQAVMAGYHCSPWATSLHCNLKCTSQDCQAPEVAKVCGGVAVGWRTYLAQRPFVGSMRSQEYKVRTASAARE
jgi:hypothetical protein